MVFIEDRNLNTGFVGRPNLVKVNNIIISYNVVIEVSDLSKQIHMTFIFWPNRDIADKLPIVAVCV